MFKTSPRRELLDAARFTAAHAGLVADDPASARWLTVGAVLIAQNACVAALEGAGAVEAARRTTALWKPRRAGDVEAGAPKATVGLLELLARVSDPVVLPQPFVLPYSAEDRVKAERLMALRNLFLHTPPGETELDLSDLPDLVSLACRIAMHLAVTQPSFAPDGWARDAEALRADLAYIETSMAFLRDAEAAPD